MSNYVPLEYKGNIIFRNQPNHAFFDKRFEDEHDCMFQFLNDIDPHFVTSQQQAENISLSLTTVTDPRTKKQITQLLYDHTKEEEETKIFSSPKKSFMTEKEHDIGVRVLYSLQQGLEVEEEDMYNWYRIQQKRQREVVYFKNFLLQLNQSIKEQLYSPCRKLLELYQKWYRSKLFDLKKRYREETYNTHLGLPQVRQCKNVLCDQQVEIINQEVMCTVGERCCWQDNIKDELKKISYSISSYVDVYKNSEDLKDSLEDNLKLQFLKIARQEIEEIPNFYMPLESLLFLLTAGDYVDMPTEMLLNITETENLDIAKCITMDIPLPSRQCGWHTYDKIVEHAILAKISINETKVCEENSKTNNDFCNCTEFKVSTLEDFMATSLHIPDKSCKFAKTLAKWQLATVENNQHFQIYTSFDNFTDNKSVALKLEHKAKFGCEVLTKYQILKYWFRLKLLGISEISCLRLDVTNYQPLLEETLTTPKLEEHLASVYRINCNELLNNLFEFLKMLYNMPSGQYMLRYNPKYRDKLLLCKPSQEITQNTINLYKLLDTDVTDIEFMSQNNFLPIDENLCGLMHLQHKILPAAFSPLFIGKNKSYNNQASFSQPKKVSQNGRFFGKSDILQKFKNVKKSTMTKIKKKRIRRTKKKSEASEAKTDLRELENDISLDSKMLSFC